MRHALRNGAGRLALPLLVFGLLGLGLGAAPTLAGPAVTVAGPKLVLAFFYSWYGPGAFDSGQMSDRPAAPYVSDHAGVIDRQIQDAQNAGIDAFISSWMGDGSETAQNFPAILSAAAAHNFKVTVYFEVDSVMQHGDLRAQLREIINATGSDAFLRWNGKPVIFFWRPEAAGDAAAWNAIRHDLDPNHALLWSADTVNAGYLDAFDTIHFFSAGMWAANTNVAAVDAQWRGTVDNYNRQHGTQRLWTAGVVPGWDESHVPGRANPKVFPRNNGALYETNWRAAIASNPEWITITSWNEWYEGTQIEPSAGYGNLYLDLTRKWAQQFKGSAPAPAPTPKPAPPAPTQCETQNGHQLCGVFRAYWHNHGSLAQQGLPISDELTEASLTDPGKRYTVQYFERAVFEYHPEYAGTAYEVLLTLLGNVRYNCKYPGGAPGQQANSENPRFFPDSGHTIGGAFRAYWEQHGGLAQQGLPISDEFTEASDLDPGKRYTVQYFERAVFEFHPENAGSPYIVLLSQLGAYYHDHRLCPGKAVQVSSGDTRTAPADLRFFTSASQGCAAAAQTNFPYPHIVYAQLALAAAPAGTTVEVQWRGGAKGYNHTDAYTVPKAVKPACIDGFSLDPSRYAIGPGAYTVALRLNGAAVSSVNITITR